MRTLSLLVAASIPALAAHAQHTPPATATAPVVFTSQLARADLAAFRENVLEKDAAFTPSARAEGRARLDKLDAAADTLHRAYFELELSRIVALADNGHTSSPPVMRAPRFNRVPFRLTPLDSGFYVLRAQAAHADLLGAKLVSIDGKPVNDVRAVARTLSGGINRWRDRYAPYFMESPALMQALGVVRDSTAATFEFVLGNNRKVSRRIAADAPSGPATFAPTSRWLSPSEFQADGHEWRTLLTEADAPWSLREWGKRFRWRDAPEVQGVVVELRQNVDAGEQKLTPFLTMMLDTLKARAPRVIVLDMRFNSGGNLQITRDFAESLPKIASERVFVITSPYTFSAAISTVGYLKQAAPDKVTIVGEGLGDRLNFFAEGRPFDLPGTGVGFGVTTQRHDYETGCTGYKDCHLAVALRPIRVKSLEPEIMAPWTIGALMAKKDPSMEAIAARLNRK
jgi:hypothetical protein